jgi:FdhD protein
MKSVNVNSAEKIKIIKFINNINELTEDFVAAEEPLEISLMYGNVNSRIKKIISITMRTPGNDEELALGFLFTEGILKKIEQVSDVKQIPNEENKIQIILNENAEPYLPNSERNFYTTSSCGVCGKTSIESIRTVSAFNNIHDELSLNADIFYKLNEALRNEQIVFESTGGLHASAIFDSEGNIKFLREDVGRHNALDKLIGFAFKNDKLPLNNEILMLSGRASFELIQKAVMAGIRVIAAVGAPSSLAVQMAEDAGITLIGFLKNESFNVYSGENRIKA